VPIAAKPAEPVKAPAPVAAKPAPVEVKPTPAPVVAATPPKPAPAPVPPVPPVAVAPVAAAPAPAPAAAPKAVEAPAIAAKTIATAKTETAPATKPAVQNVMKGFLDMATASSTAAATDKLQALFGDFNERAKTAYEKSVKLGEEFSELTKGNVEAIVASARVAAKGAEALSQEAADYGKKSFEQATGAFKSFAGVKSPTELFQLQSDFAKSSFDSAVSEASKLSEAWVKLAGDVFQPLSNRYAVAAEKLKAASF
jgi:phasin family protein